jgi:co-chaperonin GroES (HSP10)
VLYRMYGGTVVMYWGVLYVVLSARDVLALIYN